MKYDIKYLHCRDCGMEIKGKSNKYTHIRQKHDRLPDEGDGYGEAESIRLQRLSDLLTTTPGDHDKNEASDHDTQTTQPFRPQDYFGNGSGHHEAQTEQSFPCL